MGPIGRFRGIRFHGGAAFQRQENPLDATDRFPSVALPDVFCLLAEEMVRAGIGLWWNVSSVKALQIALNREVVPHESAGEDNKVEGNDVAFRDTSNDDYSCVINGAPSSSLHRRYVWDVPWPGRTS